MLQVHGGSFCAFYDHSTDVDEGKPETILAAAGAGWKRRLRQLGRLYTAPMRGLEAGSRIAQFRRVRARGGTPRQAMMHTRQISTDFADRGASPKWWTYCRTDTHVPATMDNTRGITNSSAVTEAHRRAENAKGSIATSPQAPSTETRERALWLVLSPGALLSPPSAIREISARVFA